MGITFYVVRNRAGAALLILWRKARLRALAHHHRDPNNSHRDRLHPPIRIRAVLANG